jgi:hypothetical protein
MCGSTSLDHRKVALEVDAADDRAPVLDRCLMDARHRPGIVVVKAGRRAADLRLAPRLRTARDVDIGWHF